MIDPGSELTLTYPILTHVRHVADVARRERNIVVRSVRDLVRDPLTVDEFFRRPFVHRSRWLVRALEPEIGQFRQFYLGSAAEFARPGVLRIGLYEPYGSIPVEVVAREFAPTVHDRQVMLRLLRQWKPDRFWPLEIRIFCDDFQLIGGD